MTDNTRRIEFDDDTGSWWEIKTVVTRGMRKQFRAAGLKAISPDLGLETLDADALQKAMAKNPGAMDLDGIDDAYLMAGTVAYSFGKKISIAAIDDIEDKYVSHVIDVMRELYADVDEEAMTNLDGRRSPSSPTEQVPTAS